MSVIPDRKTLEGMKRVDLQRLCKDHGLRANLKSESLIDLLIETSKPTFSSEPSRPTRSSSMRIISKSSSGSRPRGRSGGSVIIHDTDEEEEPAGTPANTGTPSHSESEFNLLPAFARTTRKAKESQYRLGVGRPALAGGSGARAVTRTGSMSKPKRGKAPSVQPNEEAIQEVDEDIASVHEPPQEMNAGPSGTGHSEPIPGPPPPAMQEEPPQLSLEQSTLSVSTAAALRSTIDEMIFPLRDEMQALHANFDEVARSAAEATSLRAQITTLTNEVASLRIQVSRNAQLETEVNILKEHIAALREMSPLNSSHTRTDSAGTTGQPSTSEPNQLPGAAIVLLGKRQRSPNDSNFSGVAETAPTSDTLRPSKKRVKLAQEGLGLGSSSSAPVASSGTSRSDNGKGKAAMPTTPGPSGTTPDLGFTVYNGPEVPEEGDFDQPPPTTHLPELFAMPGPSSSSDQPGIGIRNPSSNNGNNAFSFSFPVDSLFQPITSTPVANLGAGPIPPSASIPFPEPPTSPTPGPSPERGGTRKERSDRFHPFGGVRSPVRPRIGTRRTPQPEQQPAASGSSSSNQLTADPEQLPQFVSPAELMRTPPLPSSQEPDPASGQNSQAILGVGLGRPSSTAIGGVGLPMPMPPETPAPPMKRTMYGTELDADSRFGDFGVDGVAMGYWTGAPHF